MAALSSPRGTLQTVIINITLVRGRPQQRTQVNFSTSLVHFLSLCPSMLAYAPLQRLRGSMITNLHLHGFQPTTPKRHQPNEKTWTAWIAVYAGLRLCEFYLLNSLLPAVVWNSLPKTVQNSDSTVFRSRLKTSLRLSVFPLLTNTLPGPSASEVTT